MRTLVLITFLSVIPLLSSGQLKNGYEIDITIKDLKDSTIYLAYQLGDKQYIKDTLKLDRTGHGILHGREKLPEGIYLVVLPGKRYFEMLISGKQYFSLSCMYSDYFNTLRFTGSAENT